MENKHFVQSTQGLILKEGLGHTFLHPLKDAKKNVLVPPVGFLSTGTPPFPGKRTTGNGSQYGPAPEGHVGKGQGDDIFVMPNIYPLVSPSNALTLFHPLIYNILYNVILKYTLCPLSCQDTREGREESVDHFVNVKARHDIHISDVVIFGLCIHDCSYNLFVERLRLPKVYALSVRFDDSRWSIIIFVISFESYNISILITSLFVKSI